MAYPSGFGDWRSYVFSGFGVDEWFGFRSSYVVWALGYGIDEWFDMWRSIVVCCVAL